MHSKKKSYFLSHRCWFLFPHIGNITKNFADTARYYHLFWQYNFETGPRIQSYLRIIAILPWSHGCPVHLVKKVICALNRCKHTDLVLEDAIWTTRITTSNILLSGVCCIIRIFLFLYPIQKKISFHAVTNSAWTSLCTKSWSTASWQTCWTIFSTTLSAISDTNSTGFMWATQAGTKFIWK